MLTVTRISQPQRAQATKTRTASQAQNVENVLLIDQKLGQQQSLETVQALLLVSFTSVCYLRNLLPDQCFDDRNFDSIRKDVRFFGSGPMPDSSSVNKENEAPSSQGQSAKKQRLFKVLQRSKSQIGEKLYCWLEGIFHALAQKYLDSAQLSIILDQSHPNNVIESYNFTFSYATGPGAVYPTQSPDKPPITIAKAKENLCTVVRHLVSLCQTMPNLPDRRFLTTHLFYNDECPPTYCPPGFQPNHDLEMLVPNSEDWELRKADVGGMDLGYYNVQLRASYLSILRQEAAGTDDIAIPQDIAYSKQIPRIEPSKSTIETQIPKEPLQEDVMLPSETSATRSLPSLEPERNEVDDELAGRGIETSVRTNKAIEMQVKERLRNMIRSPSMSNDLTQTQSAIEGTQVPQETSVWRIIPGKDHELWEKRNEYIKGALLPDELWRCRCDCEFDKKEGNMVQCDCCDTWQHRHCYAIDEQDLGTIHVCYTCLLEDAEMPLLQEMRSLARKRRICWTIRNRVVSTYEPALAGVLGYSTKELSLALSDLKRDKLVATAPQSGKKRRKLIVNEKEAAAVFERIGFLHPLASIQHYYTRNVPSAHLIADAANANPALTTQGDTDIPSTEAGTDELLALGPGIWRNTSISEGVRASGVRHQDIREHPTGSYNSSTSVVDSKKRKHQQELQRKHKHKHKHVHSSKARSPVDASEPF
ncbi:DNA binding protein [Thelotrema lepadinum]|nr:DNA binding protein [Thelotrema lepadinum]